MGTFIYTLSDPISNEVRYVGKSNNPTSRLKEHIYESYKKNTHKNNWVNGLLVKNHTPIIEVIDEVEENWQFWECFYIELLKSWGFKLTNMTNGGDGVNFTPEISKKISNTLKLYFESNDSWMKGKKMSKEQKDKISHTKKGVAVHSEGYKNKLRERMKGNSHTLGMKLTEEHKKSIGDKQRGKEKHTEETKKIISEKNSGENNGMYGKTHTKESLKKISERSKGQNHPRSLLTEKDVLEIRRLHKNKEYKQTEIAKLFNVKVRTIYSITNRESWKHI
jgi:hypothetical protein